MFMRLFKTKWLFPLYLILFSLPATAQEVVSPADVPGQWYPADMRPDGTVSFVNGPQDPPLGCGSLQMTLTLYTAKSQFYTDQYKDTKLSDITAISYWSFRHGLSQNNTVQTISLNIEVDV